MTDAPARSTAPGWIMKGSALALGSLGLVLLFAPAESAALFGWGDDTLTASVAASGFLAVAMLDWMGRNAIYGGIYGRPIVVANVTFGLTAFLPLLKAQMEGPEAVAMGWLPVVVLAGHVTAFGLILVGRVGGVPRSPT